jgi:hypothetical protein
MEKGVTPLCGPWRMENGEWELPLLPACGKNLCSIHTLRFEVCCLIHHALFVVWIPGERSNPMWKIVKPSTTSFLHSPFSNLQEWALRHSRRVCHIPILHSLRMGRKRCDNPYWKCMFVDFLIVCIGPPNCVHYWGIEYHRELHVSSLHVLECSFHVGQVGHGKCEHHTWQIWRGK